MPEAVRDLERIVNETIAALEIGQDQIYDIAENSRENKSRLEQELQEIKQETLNTINEVDRLEIEERQARRQLMEVSRNFNFYGEEDMKEAYDNAKRLQMQLGLLRERENQLRLRRDKLQRQLKRAEETVEKAEKLVSQVGIAIKYLTDDLQGISLQLDEFQQRQQLGLKIILAQEEERKRVAREIHDGPAQSMANVILRAEVCEKMLERDPEQVRQELLELKTMVIASLKDVRKIIFDLRPMVLDDLGVIPALKRFIAEYQQKYGLAVEFVTLGEEKRLSAALEVAVFRIIQEALNNVVKHTRAHEAMVKLEVTDNQVNILIRDDGQGFDKEKALREETANSYGIMGMKERVEMLEGRFSITSRVGKGTTVSAQIPINK